MDKHLINFNEITVVVLMGQNEDAQTREVGCNKYITITERIYRIQVLYNS